MKDKHMTCQLFYNSTTKRQDLTILAFSKSATVFNFIEDLPNNIKSKIKLFTDDVKLSVWQLAEEITQKDPNKLKYWRYLEIKIYYYNL